MAEDNEINALLARALLNKLGHRPTVVGSGGAAIACWLAAREAGAPFDRVLMDLHMPGMDGLEARAASAPSRPRTVAAHADRGAHRQCRAEDRAACLAAGMDGFLVKPLDRERLAAALAEPGMRLAHTSPRRETGSGSS